VTTVAVYGSINWDEICQLSRYPAEHEKIDALAIDSALGGSAANTATWLATQVQRVELIGAVGDDRLRLVFTCCHPALAMEARVVLTLRLVGGLTVAEIARAFLVQEGAMARRVTRAKAKIAEARIPYRVPVAEDLPARVSGVLAVLYLVFNEGYLATGPDAARAAAAGAPACSAA
jgi:predicted RNA polymerase sigma factor